MSKKILYTTSIIIIMMIMVVVYVNIYWKPNKDLALYSIERIFRYSFTINNPTNQHIANKSFWVYAPVAQTATQKTIKIEASQLYTLRTDELGNQKLYFQIPKLAPFSSSVVTVKTVVGFSEEPNSVQNVDLNRFLRAERYLEINNNNIIATAKRLSSTKNSETVERIYSWIIKNVKDSGYIKEDRGAVYALVEKKGDCTEHAYLFTALARASNIAARSTAGYVYSESAVLRPEDYHNWAEAFIDEKWQIVDPHKRRYMEDTSHYVAMRIISVSENDPDENSQRFYGASDGVKVVMN